MNQKIKLKNIIQISATTTICFVLPLIVFSVTDDVIVEQLVDNSCNENNLCEAELGETIYTCPHDCHTGNINPAILQANAEAPPIEIYNMEISVESGAIIISWRTNKPTVSSLVWVGSVEGARQGYLEELFLVGHNVRIENLDLDRKHYFKIFAKGIFGDTNYDYAKLWTIMPFDVLETKKTEAELVDAQEINEDIAGGKQQIYKIIKADQQELGDKIIAPEERIDEKIQSIEDEKHFLSDAIDQIELFLNKTHILGEHSLSFFIGEYKWQIVILGGIILFLII